MTPVRIVDPERPDGALIAEAARVLSGGGILVYPTDTLYAIGGSALSATAADRVRAAKGRDEGKPLPVVAADLAQARALAADWPEAARQLAEACWPGALTLVVRAARTVPRAVTGSGTTIGVRVPAAPVAVALCRAAGPLVSTSANASGGPAPLTCAEALAGVGHAVDLALDGGPGRAVASTVLDVSGPAPVRVREGAVGWDRIARVLAGETR